MELFKKISGNIVLVLQVLIAFMLVFEPGIEVPISLQAFGRLHPLMLHLPIGLLIITAILLFTQRHFPGPSHVHIISFLLYLTALTCSLTALMGLFLSHEGGYEPVYIQLHKWLGVSLSFMCWFMIVQENNKVLKPALAVGVLLVIFTGHFGATLTHGENFVAGPLLIQEKKVRFLTDSSTVFSSTIEPILEVKCYGCHNEQKAKGKLILTSVESILEGGKNGKLWVPGDADHSLIAERVSLPETAKEHMPPKDKVQLTEDEISFISLWINSGADMNKKLNELTPGDTLKKLSENIIARYIKEEDARPLYTFDFASQETVQKLSTPTRTVFQIARNEPALEADFYLKQSFDKKSLEELNPVKEQIVSLNLSNMPFEDADVKLISKFPNLQKLILNNTSITGKTLHELSPLANLHLLALSGTKVGMETLQTLGSFKSLKEVFIWNTPIGKEQAEELKKKFSNINWHIGFLPDTSERLKLNVPLLKNETQLLSPDEGIMLKHHLPGVIIRYTVDGKEPDSLVSPVYKTPIEIKTYTLLKTKAYKEGWVSSSAQEYVFFRKGIKAGKIELLTKPDPKYEGEGAITLMDEVKGMPDFFKHPSWIGFRNEPLTAYFYFSDTVTVSNITISYARNIWALCMPPAEVEIWGGSDPEHLRLISKTKPTQPASYLSARIEGVSIDISPSKLACYKLVAKPLGKLPAFRNEKKEKAWLMVDEIFFN